MFNRYLLITKQWEEEARKALRRLRASNQVEEDIEEMRAEERAQQAEASISMMELICSPTLRAPLIIGVVMQLSQQLSGINAVNTIFSLFTLIYLQFMFVLGVLLFNEFIYQFWIDGRKCEIRHHRHRRHHGGNDVSFHSVDGQNWTTNLASVRVRGHVHLFDIHHYLISYKGSCQL